VESDPVPDGQACGPAVLGGWLAPLGWSIGFVEAPFAVVRDRLVTWRRTLGADLTERREPGAWPTGVESLEPLEAPWTTELLVAHGAGWTAYANNFIHGGDPWPPTSYLGDRIGVRWVVATHQPMTAVGHAATVFSLGGPGGEPPLNFIRTVEAHATDRRWSWRAEGVPMPFERTDAYRARRVRDRFTRPMLVGYLAGLGIAVDDHAAYGPATLIRQNVSWPTRRETLQQARVTWKIDPPR
jgi:hypothetical protein